MRYLLLQPVTLYPGARLVLTPDQLRRREVFVRLQADGSVLAVAPVSFKAGETIELDGVLPKALAAAAQVQVEQPAQDLAEEPAEQLAEQPAKAPVDSAPAAEALEAATDLFAADEPDAPAAERADACDAPAGARTKRGGRR